MKLALVTGGCRRLGAAISARLAAEGYALALHASANPEPDADLRAALEDNGTHWRGFAADLSDAGQIASLIPAVTDHFSRAPDLLINNAARFGEDRPENASFDALIEHYSVNTAAPALLARDLAAGKNSRNPGAIINILDQRIANPHGDQLSYTLSKIALAGLTEILAHELAPDIRVNAVAPGLTIPTADYDAQQIDQIANMMPLRQLPEPAQIADVVVWLASAEMVTGQTLFVDGGAHMKTFGRDFLHLA